ncbi:hypothetical protein [Frigidibacter mobilis]|uniref:hypothetical protein n=1 Tax=Frigidibacter mobilis TaxID=1335048 RepID=UPI0014133A73|nr:hypothetical protein [Frigidibacter mobilis]
MPTFEASVQYNDYKGTVAADGADEISMRDFLVAESLASEDERVIGFRLCF